MKENRKYSQKYKYTQNIYIPELGTSRFNGKFTKWFIEIKKKYKLSLIFDIINLLLSVGGSAIYIVSTYVPCIRISPDNNDTTQYHLYNLVSHVYFLIDFLFNLLTMKNVKKFHYYTYVLVEVITILPFLIIFIIKSFTADQLLQKSPEVELIIDSLICLRIYRLEYLSKYIQSEINKKLYTITVSIFSLLIFTTSIVNVIENTQTAGVYSLYLPQDCFDNDCFANVSTYHSTFFFVMTTISTIGYYSMITSTAGRLLIIVLIVTSLLVIPQKCSELMNLLTSKSIYSRTTYTRLEKVSFVIITGNISYSCLNDLLQEYFHPDHGENERHCLVLMNSSPDNNMKILLQDYQNKLFYFQGDPLKYSDLIRCQFHLAETIMLMCNKQTDDPNAEDSKTILQAMAIRKFLYQLQSKSMHQTKMLIQLLRPESELHMAISFLKKNNLDQILCIDELKLTLLAKSCLCQGIIALVSNLIMTSNLGSIRNKILDKNNWLEEYKKGKGYEIYLIPLDNFKGYNFIDLAQLIYQKRHVILIGLNIVSVKEQDTLVLLNPANFDLPNDNEVNLGGYILAEDVGVAEDIIQWSVSYKKDVLINNPPTDDLMTLMNHANTGSLTNKTKFRSESFVEIEPELDNQDEYNDIYNEVHSISKICHITIEPIDRLCVTMESIDNMLIAKDHIIICGISQNIIDFIKPLRAKHLPKSECPAIVILNIEIPDDKLWSTIAFFDQIYLIKGDPMNKFDLYRAGIRNAKKVVILSPEIKEILNYRNDKINNLSENAKNARKLSREEEDLLDSKTIFKYNMISKLKKDIFIVCELINPKNVSFIYNKGRTHNDEFSFIRSNMKIDGTISFASGEVYFSSIMDNLIVQAFYNQSLLAFLKKLIVGEDHSTISKAPLNKYSNYVSSNLYLIDLSKYEEEIKQQSKREDFEFVNLKRSFRDVFNYFLKHKMIVIGVYRSIDSIAKYEDKIKVSQIGTYNNYNRSNINANPNTTNQSSNFYYVVTSPPNDFEVEFTDKIFVLSQTFPNFQAYVGTNINAAGSKAKESPGGANPGVDKEFFQFTAKMKKVDEKKEQIKALDHIGEFKLKEVNHILKDSVDYLKLLKYQINLVKEKIDKNLPEIIKGKIDNMLKEESGNGESDNFENSSLNAVSDNNNNFE